MIKFRKGGQAPQKPRGGRHAHGRWTGIRGYLEQEQLLEVDKGLTWSIGGRDECCRRFVGPRNCKLAWHSCCSASTGPRESQLN